MRTRRLNSLGAVPLVIAGTAVLAASMSIAPALPTPVKTLLTDVKLLDTEGWIIGGSGVPIPSQSLIDAALANFAPPTPLFPGQPLFPVSAVHPVFTPEGFYPFIGVKTLPLDTSAAQGVSILNSLINDQIAAGNNLVVGGGSQSATIASMEMKDLLALPVSQQPTADQLAFVEEVNPSSPDGGILERFHIPGVPLSFPSLGISFTGATPADTPWDTAIYDREYDGFSDWPRYPINFLADLNAVLGIVEVHAATATAPPALIAQSIERPVSDDYTGHTQYFMVPTENLPLLDPIRVNPLGNAVADLLQPDLKVLVNLGYGSITDGWDPGPANVPTPMGVFPTDINPADVLSALASGAQQGVRDFVHDLGSLGSPSTSSITSGLTGGDGADAVSHADSAGVAVADNDSLPSLTDIVNEFSGELAKGYAALLPIADALNGELVTLPAYDVSLFAHELASGNLLDAIGLPIAATVGLTSMDLFIQVKALDTIDNAIQSIVGDLRDLIPS